MSRHGAGTPAATFDHLRTRGDEAGRHRPVNISAPPGAAPPVQMEPSSLPVRDAVEIESSAPKMLRVLFADRSMAFECEDPLGLIFEGRDWYARLPDNAETGEREIDRAALSELSDIMREWGRYVDDSGHEVQGWVPRATQAWMIYQDVMRWVSSVGKD
jgi:hypothetical protein